MTTDIDVVIPTLNAARSLAPTLDSLGGDHGLRLAVTVCDGGSRDDTTTIARQAGATVLVSEPGRGRQLAEGAMAGRAPWLLFLHADTTLSTGWAAAFAFAFAAGWLVARCAPPPHAPASSVARQQKMRAVVRMVLVSCPWSVVSCPWFS